MDIICKPIGHVSSSRRELRDDNWDRESSTIALDEEVYSSDALLGLGEFSHVEVLFHFDRVPTDAITVAARHPRGNKDWPKAGIFAQRGKNRPNRIGSTVARLVGVDGLTLEVRGLDAVDGTPVLDIKPYMQEFAPRAVVRQPQWATELMQGYWSS